jgi:hypothetical protein
MKAGLQSLYFRTSLVRDLQMGAASSQSYRTPIGANVLQKAK